MNCRNAFLLVILLIIAAIIPVQAELSAEKYGLVLDKLEERWQFDKVKLEMILDLLGQVEEDDIYALHIDGIPGITVNQIDARSEVLYKGKKYSFTATSTIGRVVTADAGLSMETWGYDVYAPDGKFMMGYEEKSRDGKTICVFVEASGDGVVVKYIDNRAGGSGKLVEKRFDKLPAPYEEDGKLREFKGLKKGDISTGVSFDTDTFELSKHTMEVVEIRSKPAEGEEWVCKLDISSDDEFVATALADEKMRTVAVISDLPLVKCSLDTALQERAGGNEEAMDIQTPVTGWEGVDAFEVKRLKLQLWAKNQTDGFVEECARQSVKPTADDASSYVVVVQSERKPGKKEGLDAEIPDTKEMRDALAPDSDIESKSPEIIKKAKEIVGKEKDPYNQAMLLCEWVSGNISYTMEIGYATALETLRSGKGDCSESSFLFVALCRALGIPAEKISGWSIAGNSMFGHAWACVYARGRWIEIDPTDGELASCMDIRQAEGKLVFLEKAEILAVDHGKGMARVNVDKLPWTYQSNTYRNKKMGFSVDVPESAMFAGHEQGALSKRNKKKEAAEDGLLFSVNWLNPAKNKSNLQAIAVSTYDPEVDMVSRLDESDCDELFDGLEYMGHTSIKYGDRKIAAVKIGEVDGVSTMIYYVPVSETLSMIFTCAGDDLHESYFKALPDEVAEMVDSVKEFEPEVGVKGK